MAGPKKDDSVLGNLIGGAIDAVSLPVDAAADVVLPNFDRETRTERRVERLVDRGESIIDSLFDW
jgi:hypothetical protein